MILFVNILISIFFQLCRLTFPRLASVANFGTDYFLLKIIFLAKREREFTTNFAIAPNVCWQTYYFFSFFMFSISAFILAIFSAYFSINFPELKTTSSLSPGFNFKVSVPFIIDNKNIPSISIF